MVTITDVFSALPAIYARDGDAGSEELLTRLERLKSGAAVAGELVMAARAGWAKSLIMGKVSDLAGRTELLSIAKWVDPKLSRPAISVSVAEALLEAGNPLTAKELFTNIRKWNPRCVEKARIYRGLGDIALVEKDSQKALEYYAMYEREAVQTVALGGVKFRKAEIYAGLGQKAKARAELESVLETPGVTAEAKAGALMKIGELHVGDGEHEKAIVYFERVYVAYGKFGGVNARAYWERGQSLEALNLKKEALETYEELVARDDLSRFNEVELAEEKVTKLRRLFPPELIEMEEEKL
jgi:tetratricopeptide (TPR) repeat protein